MKNLLVCNKYIAILILCLVIVACDSEVDPDSSVDIDDPRLIDPTEASTALVLQNATKINGSLPPAPEGNLKINHEDTIYVVSDLPFGARVVIEHEPIEEISGFYVGVPNSAFYYDVPKKDEDTEPYTSVFYLNYKDIGNPAIPINIQPYVNGIPADEFKKFIRVIKPVEDVNCLFNEKKEKYRWVWEFTVIEDHSGDIHTAYAPNMYVNSPGFSYGGCCWCNSETGDCFSTPAQFDPYCLSGNPEYYQISVEDEFDARHFGGLDLYENGLFEWLTRSDTKKFDPEFSDYCEDSAAYLTYENVAVAEGTHDFTPGAKTINFNVTNSFDFHDPTTPGHVWHLPNGTLMYTCKSLIISQAGSHGVTSIVFRRGKESSTEDLWTSWPEYYD